MEVEQEPDEGVEVAGSDLLLRLLADGDIELGETLRRGGVTSERMFQL